MAEESVGAAGSAAAIAFGVVLLTVLVLGVVTLDMPAVRAGRRAVRAFFGSDVVLSGIGLVVAVVAGLALSQVLGLDSDPELPPAASASAAQGFTPMPSPATPTGAVLGDVPAEYVVRQGDSLRSIAGRILGSEAAWTEIYDLNRSIIPDPDRLAVGLRLAIPAD